MKIGELAKATSTTVATIRFYEREHLLPPLPRSEANYRVYSGVHAERLAFIRHCRSLDMTLDEVRVLLRFKDAPNENCAEVDRLLDAHLGHVVARIRELRALQKQLKDLRSQCRQADAAKQCGILNELTLTAREAKVPSPRVNHVRGFHALRRRA